ncbi:uncharacterized protein LOC128198859 [Bicyclus anynana]|uniref:Uncharacterized protein LOC128198859 n=1 Tax=Bicyclus anynana TaxID=110368 RepID=A0ABM3LT21_BICAN|nr:uncharacterized protein LOC128198859 [Bicyclus anynana]
MHMPIIFLLILVNVIVCRDFYVGMFKHNDILVAQDRLYKESEYHSRVIAKYGRMFKCPITYFRVVDRLGIGRGPTVEILRGGLRKKFLVLRILSIYNYPVSVNIYVGCENKMARELTTPLKPDTITDRGSFNKSDVTATTKDASKDDST